MTILVDEFRSQQQERPLRSYDAIHLMDWHSENSASLGNSVIAKGWKLWNHPKIQVAPPIDWLHLCSANRSWNYNLHGWRFLAPILASLSHEKMRSF